MGIFDKAIELVSKSDRLGFALFGAAAVVFLVIYLGLSPVAINPETLTWIGYVGLVGGLLLLVRILAESWKALCYLGGLLSRWWWRHRVGSRVNNLSKFERACLLWILNNPDEILQGDPTDSPWSEFHTHGFIKLTRGILIEQAFILNPRASNGRKELEKRIKDWQMQGLSKGTEAPWVQKARANRMRI